MQLPEHFILIDKPKGITSFDVIRELRTRTGIKKWGHAGTLDPLATGLMLLAHDRGTKQLSEFIKLDKEYIAEVLIGERRSTGDMEGEVLEEKMVDEAAEIFIPKISAALESMVGTLTLPVSAYSAIKKDGVPMYKRARKAEKSGETVDDVPMREMIVHEAELLHTHYIGGQTSNETDASSSWRSDLQLGFENSTVNSTNKCIATVRFSVGSGTYIRSLTEELGRRLAPTPKLSLFLMTIYSVLGKLSGFFGFTDRANYFRKHSLRQYWCRGLGYPATLQNLRRTRVGEYDIEDAQQLERIN